MASWSEPNGDPIVYDGLDADDDLYWLESPGLDRWLWRGFLAVVAVLVVVLAVRYVGAA